MVSSQGIFSVLHYFHRGIAYAGLGEYKLAIVDFKNALAVSYEAYGQLAGYRQFIYFHRGKAYFALKHYQAAIDNFESSLEEFTSRDDGTVPEYFDVVDTVRLEDILAESLNADDSILQRRREVNRQLITGVLRQRLAEANRKLVTEGDGSEVEEEESIIKEMPQKRWWQFWK